LALAENIKDIQVFVGSFDELKIAYKGSAIYFKEHPLNKHYKGYVDERSWIIDGAQATGSFFSFWKKNEKGIRMMVK
jgi:deoxyribodipyrimidine photo-lyase